MSPDQISEKQALPQFLSDVESEFCFANEKASPLPMATEKVYQEGLREALEWIFT